MTNERTDLDIYYEFGRSIVISEVVHYGACYEVVDSLLKKLKGGGIGKFYLSKPVIVVREVEL